MNRPAPAWLTLLAEPQRAVDATLAEWQQTVRLARRLRLLGRVAEAVDAAGLLDRLPAPVQQHLLAELRASRHRVRALVWTAEHVSQVLAGAAYPRVLLKGAAYLAQQLPIAAGRLPSDLDILVPRDAVADAQRRLQAHGWQEVELDAHDQRFYRDYSHEVPPMRHPQFRLELDLHHTILPPVARTRVDAALLLARVQPSGWPRWQVLCPVDQILHSAAHLFLDAELRDRLRDLVDLDGLMRHGAQRPGFWPELLDRSRELGLDEPLALAVEYTSNWLQTPVPASTLRSLRQRGPGAVRRAWLLPLLDTVLTPADPDALPARSQDLAATLLLARYQLQRLPLHLLLPHVWHKVQGRRRNRDDGDDAF
ncbi:MAG: nucleotidyltransferase family protein [Proteobacteria bacterium]|nr:nucleotidyltransferase family protein [Pseudomonadota bacterium]